MWWFKRKKQPEKPEIETEIDVNDEWDEMIDRIKAIEIIVARMDRRYYRSRENWDEESDRPLEPPEHPMLRGI
jgi:hypothetical protein